MPQDMCYSELQCNAHMRSRLQPPACQLRRWTTVLRRLQQKAKQSLSRLSCSKGPPPMPCTRVVNFKLRSSATAAASCLLDSHCRRGESIFPDPKSKRSAKSKRASTDLARPQNSPRNTDAPCPEQNCKRHSKEGLAWKHTVSKSWCLHETTTCTTHQA